MNRTHLLVPALAAALSLSCTHNSNVIVYVSCDTNSLSPALDMTSVRVTVTNNVDSQQTFFPPSNSASSGNILAFPATFAIVIPPSRSGAVTVDIEGLDDRSQVITHGSATSTIHVGERTNIYITLEPGGLTCGDKYLDEGESCDDGNQLSGDGCDAACRTEAGGVKPGADGGTSNRTDARPSGDGGVQDIVTVVDGGAPTTPLSGSAFVSLAAGNGFSCGARQDGSLYCWGDNSQKQLGITLAKSSLLAPAQLAGSRWLATTAGQYHACAVDSSNVVTCWGQADSGQLGKAATNGQIVQVAGSDWSSVSAGSYHTCAKKLDNSLWCWGYNSSGQLGLGLSAPQESAAPGMVSDELKWAMLSVGAGHSCASKSDGTLWCWGSNANGQIGIGTSITTFSPAQVAGTGFATVSAGASHTCATRADGSLACWGLNDIGQLGDGTTAQRSVPTSVPGNDWVVVGAGSAHTCAVKTDGSLWCWGENSKGQLGDGTNTNRIQPTRILNPSGPWAAIALGNGHTCGTLATGSLYCWGDNAKGQLGDGTTTPRTKPILIISAQ